MRIEIEYTETRSMILAVTRVVMRARMRFIAAAAIAGILLALLTRSWSLGIAAAVLVAVTPFFPWIASARWLRSHREDPRTWRLTITDAGYRREDDRGLSIELPWTAVTAAQRSRDCWVLLTGSVFLSVPLEPLTSEQAHAFERLLRAKALTF